MEAVCIDLTPRVLVAEDDRELRELLALVLENAGYQVCQCSNGEQLLTRLKEQPAIDLVISDIRMPGLNGLEVLARRNRHLQQIPFICMTAFGDEQTHRKARHLGAAAVIDKPFDLDDMMTLIAHVCLRNERIKGVDHENK
ncbi:response regulator [Pelovirga terrestris]|uniref:Response regulator n=1 Tax=Pelovirga terrestris TaxID=2771352 RepID=A0A8J6UL86_9BACT|nr:response regulator [Pelovirga terrestris]MBD1400802.1 response regulator [Pelovirga terrestris]